MKWFEDIILRLLYRGGMTSCKVLNYNLYVCDNTRSVSYLIVFGIALLIGIIGSYVIRTVFVRRGTLGIWIVALLCLLVLASVFMLSKEMPEIVAVLTLQCFLGLILGICSQWTAPFLWRNRGQILELFDKIRGLF
jgi:predicted MFS family arabinose efflux permease